MDSTEQPGTEPNSGAAICRHYWVLKSPERGANMGVCKYCGSRRIFHTITDDQVWEEERSADLKYWGSEDLGALARVLNA